MIPEFTSRLALLLSLMAIMAAWDYWRNAQEATRWRSYLILLVAGAAGACLAMVFGQICATISPHYYTVGKGLSPVDLRFNVMLYNAQTGAVAGIIAGAVLNFAHHKLNQRPLSPSGLIRPAMHMTAGLILGALVLGPVIQWLDPTNLRSQLVGTLTQDDIAPFLLTYGLHLGAYAGAGFALLRCALTTKRHEN